jgi:hypothetical protein
MRFEANKINGKINVQVSVCTAKSLSTIKKLNKNTKIKIASGIKKLISFSF